MSRTGSKLGFAAGVLGVGALHFGVSFFVSFAAGISPPGSAWQLASKVLMFPLLSIPALAGLPLWTYWPLWGALSLGWGFAICFVVRRCHRAGQWRD